MLKPDCARRKSCQSAFGQGFDSPQLHQKGIGRTPISSAAASPRSVRSDPQQKSAVLEVIPRRRFLPHIILSDILLVFWRDMRTDRAVLAESSVQPGKGTDPVSTAEGLHSGSGEPDICLLPDVSKGNGAVYALRKSYAERIVVAG